MPSRKHSLLAVLLIFSFCANTSAQEISRESLQSRGSYQVSFYSGKPAAAELSAATIYFPANKGQDFGGIVISPGYSESQEDISWWGDYLASHGFAVLIFDTSDLYVDPQQRADALMAAVELLRNENDRMGGLLRGKIIKERMAIMGHSMGGGGSLIAANAHSAELKAVIPFTPWQPDTAFSEISIPTLIIAGENDSIAAVAEHALPHFQSLSPDIPKMYLEINDGNHFIANTDTGDDQYAPNVDVHGLLGGMVVAWLKLFVDGDEDYRKLVFGEMPASDRERLSMLEFSE